MSEPHSFLLFQEQVQNALNEADETAFGKLKDDEQRSRFVARFLAAKGFRLPFKGAGSPKNAELALERRNDGNKAFQKGDYNASQQLYTQSLQLANDPESICVALANRSAALYHMKHYILALDDLKELQAVGAYPKNLQYKVTERLARCYLALEQRLSARDAFRQTLVALDDAKLDSERKNKWRMDVQIMLVMLQKGVLQDIPLPTFDALKPPPLAGGPKKNFPSASASLHFEWAGAVEGRMARCNSKLRAGDTVIVEKPIVSALLPRLSATHCWHCLQRLRTALPCPTCCEVFFCGTKCRDAALKTHHRWECAFQPTLREAGTSITCQLALRVASMNTPATLRKAVKGAEENDPCLIGEQKYDPRDFVNLFSLVTHTERSTQRALLQRTVMALFLVHGLTKGGYFGAKAKFGKDLSADQAFVGAAILKALQVAKFNSHEVAELVSKNTDEDPISLFVGAGLYPTLALLNHSCNPSVVRYFAPGGVVVGRTVRTLQPGEEVSENYGPLWTREDLETRRQRLRDQYWFDCACEACDGDWPLYKDIPEDSIRLRCGGCSAAIKFGEEQIAATCLVCGHKTSVLASLAGVADTERKMQLAQMRAMDKPDEALDMFVQVLEAMDKFLAPPPCKDYVLSQQGLRKCLLQMGNWHHAQG